MSQVWVGPIQSEVGRVRRAQLRAARLYFVTDDGTPEGDLPTLIREVVAGGVDMIQLRRKGVDPAELGELAQVCRTICHEQGALFLVDDHVELAAAVGADGVHVGQADREPGRVRGQLGADALIGLSTHSPEQVLQAANQPVDYLSAGPVHATPTKPGRPAVGFEHVSAAAMRSSLPVVAIGGLGPGNAATAVSAGADIVAVVRALAQARDPRTAARNLKAELETAKSWVRLQVNGQARKCPPGSSVLDFLERVGVAQDGIVIERNGEILRAVELDQTELTSGDELELVHLVGGGKGNG
ncbi:MAG: thiamine phosphate synthase [Candidatus Dormiibacterota bacterium]